MNSASATFINPLTDFGFKYLFGQEEHKQFLLSFLNSLMTGQRVITDVEFVDKERINEDKNGRALIYDLHCKTADGHKIIVEMQNRYQTYFRDRAIFYMSGDIYHQGRRGSEWNYCLTPVYGVFMMNFDWHEGQEEPLREDVCLMNECTHEVFSDKMRMTFLKIPMMDKDADDCRDTFDRWLYLLKHMDKMEVMPKVFMNDPVFRRLGEVAKVAALTDNEREAYDKSLKVYRDSYAIAETERAEGREEGRVEGRAEGRAEEKLSNARNLKKLGIPIDIIAKGVGLSESEIASL